jgi:uncharacterized protein DUF6510
MTADTDLSPDLNTELMLDGNALAGTLHEIFGADVTAASCECAACGNHAEMGTFMAFTQGPGAVLRCTHMRRGHSSHRRANRRVPPGRARSGVDAHRAGPGPGRFRGLERGVRQDRRAAT